MVLVVQMRADSMSRFQFLVASDTRASIYLTHFPASPRSYIGTRIDKAYPELLVKTIVKATVKATSLHRPRLTFTIFANLSHVH